MDTVIDQGTARNVLAVGKSGELSPSPEEKRFVTYTNTLGAVHTIIVDVEHAVKDAETLIKWTRAASAAITHKSRSPETSPHHLSPADVLKFAYEAIGAVEHAAEPLTQPAAGAGGEGA